MLDGAASYSPTLLAQLSSDLQKGLNWLSLMHPEDQADTAELLPTLQAHRVWTAKRRMRVKDGRYRWMQIQAIPQFAAEGAFMGYSGMLTALPDQLQLRPTDLH